jgi:hypothetical protein
MKKLLFALLMFSGVALAGDGTPMPWVFGTTKSFNVLTVTAATYISVSGIAQVGAANVRLAVLMSCTISGQTISYSFNNTTITAPTIFHTMIGGTGSGERSSLIFDDLSLFTVLWIKTTDAATDTLIVTPMSRKP